MWQFSDIEAVESSTHKTKNAMMRIGKIKWFDKAKGQGFIITEDGKELFVHETGISRADLAKIKDGEQVSFTIAEGKRGPQAVDVKVV